MKTAVYKSNLIIAIILSILIVNQSEAATDVGGIIDTDTTWDLAGSPYRLTSDVEIAAEATLTIEAGVVVERADDSQKRIHVWGTLDAVGTDSSIIVLDALDIYAQEAGSINIQHSEVRGCLINIPYSDSGGELVLKNSTLYNFRSDIVGAGNDCFIEKNIFIGAEIESRLHSSLPKIFIRNNVFYNPDPYYGEGVIKITDGTSQNVIEFNSFLSTDKVYIMFFPYNADWEGNIIAKNNFWNTTNTDVIDSMIYDRKDTLSIPYYVEYQPFLTEPHVDTPDYTPFSIPTADAGPDQIVHNKVTLDGSLSSDPDSEIISYEWTLVHRDNPAYNRSVEGVKPTVSNLEIGFYDVTLTVTNSLDKKDTDKMLLAVAGSKTELLPFPIVVAPKNQ
jgi:hypothetical protein